MGAAVWGLKIYIKDASHVWVLVEIGAGIAVYVAAAAALGVVSKRDRAFLSDVVERRT